MHSESNDTGNENIGLGFTAGGNLHTGDHNIYVANLGGGSNESGTIRIGDNTFQTATFIAGISGATVPNCVTVFVNGNGRLGTMVSLSAFKEEIKPMGSASEAILALKPVTFHYKQEIDPNGIPQFGLVAEDVEKVNPTSDPARQERRAPPSATSRSTRCCSTSSRKRTAPCRNRKQPSRS